MVYWPLLYTSADMIDVSAPVSILNPTRVLYIGKVTFKVLSVSAQVTDPKKTESSYPQ